MARRKSDTELSFDSMTDLITNLSGGLILIVLLVLGLTRAAPRLGGRPLRPVLEQKNQLRSDVDSADEQLRNAARELDALEAEAQQLLEHSARGPGTEV